MVPVIVATGITTHIIIGVIGGCTLSVDWTYYWTHLLGGMSKLLFEKLTSL